MFEYYGEGKVTTDAKLWTCSRAECPLCAVEVKHKTHSTWFGSDNIYERTEHCVEIMTHNYPRFRQFYLDDEGRVCFAGFPCGTSWLDNPSAKLVEHLRNNGWAEEKNLVCCDCHLIKRGWIGDDHLCSRCTKPLVNLDALMYTRKAQIGSTCPGCQRGKIECRSIQAHITNSGLVV